MFLRDLPDGARFVLCRTGDKFRLLRRERINGRVRHLVEREDGRWKFPEHLSFLHPSCRVKPLLVAKTG